MSLINGGTFAFFSAPPPPQDLIFPDFYEILPLKCNIYKYLVNFHTPRLLRASDLPLLSKYTSLNMLPLSPISIKRRPNEASLVHAYCCLWSAAPQLSHAIALSQYTRRKFTICLLAPQFEVHAYCCLWSAAPQLSHAIALSQYTRRKFTICLLAPQFEAGRRVSDPSLPVCLILLPFC